MLLVLLCLAAAAASLVPPGLVALGLWCRAWPRARKSELVLAACLTLPALCLAEVYALGWLPIHRPFDWLRWVHSAVVFASLAVLLSSWRRRSTLANQERPGSAPLGAAALGVLIDIRHAARRLNLSAPVRATLLTGAILCTAMFAWAVWAAQWSDGDGPIYHLPQALQPWQDGRLGTVHAAAPWADSFVRSGALLKFWLFAISGTDAAFNAASCGMALIFLLGTYVAGRNLGLGREGSLLAAALVPSGPIFGYLCGVAYVDIDWAACVVTSFAFALPGCRNRAAKPSSSARSSTWPRLLACGLGLVLAWWIKFFACVPLAGIIGYTVVTSAWSRGARAGKAVPNRAGAPGIGGTLAWAAITLALGSIPYVRVYLEHGNPVWPVRLPLGPVVLFDGPLGDRVVGGGHDNALERFSAAWMHWFFPIDGDTPGSTGPLFALLCLVPLFSTLLWAWRGRAALRGWPLVSVLFALVLVVPRLHIPRFSIFVLALGALVAIALWRAMPRSSAGRDVRGALAIVALALIGFNAALFWRTAERITILDSGSAGSEPVSNQSSTPLSFFGWHRNRPAAMAMVPAVAGWPTHATRMAAWAATPPGETIITAVAGHTFYMYDLDYTIRVEHRPAAPWPVDFDPVANLSHGESSAAAWLESLQRDRIATVLVYKGSVEDRTLATDSSGFRLAHSQPPTQGPVIVVYTRADSTSRR